MLHLRLAAGQEKNLNPTLLCDTLLRLVELPWEWKRIYRLDLLDKDYQPFSKKHLLFCTECANILTHLFRCASCNERNALRYRHNEGGPLAGLC